MNARTFRSHHGLLAVALIGVTLSGLAGCGKGKEEHSELAPGPTVQAQVITVRSETIPKNYEVTGNLKARLNAVLSTKVMAKVLRVDGNPGDKVRVGQRLVSLDTRELSAAVDVAGANLNSARVGVGNASTAVELESANSVARIAEAEAMVQQSKAAVAAAQARLDLALAGPRTQEREQARLAVEQAQVQMQFAKSELDRANALYAEGAISKRSLEMAQSAYDVARAQYNSAVQSKRIADDGSRSQEIQSARAAVQQAQAALQQAEAGLKKARANQLAVKVRQEELKAARSQVSQSQAALRSAEVGLSYGYLSAPFDGVIVSRLADPGMMAAPGVPLISMEGGGLRLEAVVPESMLRNIEKGATMPVLVDAVPSVTFDGLVTEIEPNGDASSHSFVVRLSLPDDPRLKSGMFGRAQIRIGTDSSILVPNTSIFDREGLRYVYAVNSSGQARLRIVTLGSTIGDRRVVLSGLNPGDTVVISNVQNVSDGSKIEAISR